MEINNFGGYDRAEVVVNPKSLNNIVTVESGTVTDTAYSGGTRNITYRAIKFYDGTMIEAIKVPKEYAEGTIRVSFGKHNTKEDAIAIAKAIAKVLKT